MILEGCLVERDGALYNIMRYEMGSLTPNYGLAIALRVDLSDPEARLRFERTVDFPANHSKFVIHRHAASGTYYSLATRISDPAYVGARTTLSLMRSPDLWNWEVVRDIWRRPVSERQKVGFQYSDFLIEGDGIPFLTRVAYNGARSFHDANYSVFDRIDIKGDHF